MIETAVILAAGLGSRMGARTLERPKGFIEVGGKSLIEHSLGKLISAGVNRVLIVTGHCSEHYERLAASYPQVKCLHNPNFSSTGSMESLSLLENELKDSFFLLESDLFYEKYALDVLNKCKEENVVVTSGFTSSGDEVYVELSRTSTLLNLSKNRSELNAAHAEFVGINKISKTAFDMMCSYYKQQLSQRLDYEIVMAKISKEVEFVVKKIDGLCWCEIDTEEHYERAIKQILPRVRALESYPAVEKNILLNPGPATTSDRVKYAQIVPDICPREKEFGMVLEDVRNRITDIVADREGYTTVLFGGSGTAAVESILSSIISDGDKMIIINNGAYGERMCEIASVYGLKFREFESPLHEPIDLVKLVELIEADQEITHLALVHNETSTGLLNNIAAVGGLCKAKGIDLIVDAMSSFGAVPIQMEEMNVSYLASSANKNLQGMAGVSFVVSNKELLQKGEKKPKSYYLDLFAQHEYFEKHRQMRFTPPVQTIYALRQALVELSIETREGRYDRYKACWGVLVEGLRDLKLETLVEEEHHSKIITAIIEPSHPAFSFQDLHDKLQRKGITIYPGKNKVLRTFRVANIGDITPGDIQLFLQTLREYLFETGFLE